MPKSKYEFIYNDLKSKIESQEYKFSDILPSESNEMITIYSCSRNTIRRAISKLAEEGYVQSVHGKGIQVIFQPNSSLSSTIGGIESFNEFALRNNKIGKTKVINFTEIICDSNISKKSGFPINSELYYIQRLRYLDERPLILDSTLFLKEEVKELTIEIIESSVYDYLENILGMQIITSKRKMSIARVTPIDKKYLELNGCNCLAVISSQTYNSSGIMFEYTESHHCPDYFSYYDTAIRKNS